MIYGTLKVSMISTQMRDSYNELDHSLYLNMIGSSDPERMQPNIAIKGLSVAYLAIALSRST